MGLKFIQIRWNTLDELCSFWIISVVRNVSFVASRCLALFLMNIIQTSIWPSHEEQIVSIYHNDSKRLSLLCYVRPEINWKKNPFINLNSAKKTKINCAHLNTYHSMIRGILIQSCSAGAKNVTNYVFCHPQLSGVIQNIEIRCAILTLFVYVDY